MKTTALILSLIWSVVAMSNVHLPYKNPLTLAQSQTNEAAKLAYEQKKPLMIYKHATWCGYCYGFHRELKRFPNEWRKIQSKVIFHEEDHMDTMQVSSLDPLIIGFPYVVMFNPQNGEFTPIAVSHEDVPTSLGQIAMYIAAPELFVHSLAIIVQQQIDAKESTNRRKMHIETLLNSAAARWPHRTFWALYQEISSQLPENERAELQLSAPLEWSVIGQGADPKQTLDFLEENIVGRLSDGDISRFKYELPVQLNQADCRESFETIQKIKSEYSRRNLDLSCHLRYWLKGLLSNSGMLEEVQKYEKYLSQEDDRTQAHGFRSLAKYYAELGEFEDAIRILDKLIVMINESYQVYEQRYLDKMKELEVGSKEYFNQMRLANQMKHSASLQTSKLYETRRRFILNQLGKADLYLIK